MIVDPDVGRYVDALADRGGAQLAALEDQGKKEGWPIVGAAVGNLLFTLARGIGAKSVLELGTAIGYSAAWLAEAVGPDGRVTTVEGDPDTAGRARANLDRLGLADRVDVRQGLAQRVLAGLDGPFDFIFNDIDKLGYPEVLEPAILRLRVGGLLVTDNVLWHGDVARPGGDATTGAIRTYNERLAKDPRMTAVILPLRDGVSVALKLAE